MLRSWKVRRPVKRRAAETEPTMNECQQCLLEPLPRGPEEPCEKCRAEMFEELYQILAEREEERPAA